MVNEDREQELLPSRYLLLALGATALTLLPVVVSPHLPLLDVPAHEARLVVLHNHLLGKSSPFYTVTSFFLPDIAFDVIGVALINFVGLETAGRIFAAVSLVLTLWGVLILSRVAIGRWSLLPIAGTLLLYNLGLTLGLLNYVFGVSLIPWALAGRLALDRTAPMAWRFTFGGFVSVLLLFCHPIVFGIYTTMACGIGLTTWLRERHLSLRAIIFALEGLPALVLFLVMPRVASSLGQSEDVQYWAYDHPFALGKLVGIAKSFTSASVAGDVACIIGLIGVVAVCILGRARMQVALLPGLVGLGLFYLLLPDVLGPAGYVDKRLPFVVALLGLAALDLRIRSRSLFGAMVAFLAVSITTKQASIAVMWRSFDALYAASEAMLSALPAGSVILQAECSPASVRDPRVAYRGRQQPLTHLAALASFDDSRFVASNFARAGQQPIAVRDTYVGYYALQKSIIHTCIGDDHAARELILRIQKVAEEARLPEPVYLLLLRQRNVEPVEAALLAKDSNYALYRLIL